MNPGTMVYHGRTCREGKVLDWFKSSTSKDVVYRIQWSPRCEYSTRENNSVELIDDAELIELIN